MGRGKGEGIAQSGKLGACASKGAQKPRYCAMNANRAGKPMGLCPATETPPCVHAALLAKL
jgi:hypothetical protein